MPIFIPKTYRIVAPRHNPKFSDCNSHLWQGRGFFLCGQSPVYCQSLRAFGAFLRLQQYSSPPAPSRIQSRAKVKSNPMRKGDRAGRGLRPLPAEPLPFGFSYLFHFKIEMGGVGGRFDSYFLLNAKAFGTPWYSRGFRIAKRTFPINSGKVLSGKGYVFYAIGRL